MLGNFLINAGILLLSIYFYFKFTNPTPLYRRRDRWLPMLYGLAIGFVGIIMLNFSIVIEGVHFDFRGMLLAIAFKFVGRKAALIGLIMMTIGRFQFGFDSISFTNLMIALYIGASSSLMLHYLPKRFNDLTQLVILLCNNLMTTTLALFLFMTNITNIVNILALHWLSNFVFLFFSYLIVKDFKDMMTHINYDCLTSLNNRHRFQKDLYLINEMTRNVSLAIIDIDHFKSYNDHYGHDFGDRVLQKFSERLIAEENRHVSVYRVGGEEFALVITGLTANKSEQFVRDFHERFQLTTLELPNGQTIQLTISIGLAHRQQEEQALNTYRRADEALYYSKENGRNCITVAANDTMDPQSKTEPVKQVAFSHDQPLS